MKHILGSGDVINLTKGKIYNVVEEGESKYLLEEDDTGDSVWYPKKYFAVQLQAVEVFATKKPKTENPRSEVEMPAVQTSPVVEPKEPTKITQVRFMSNGESLVDIGLTHGIVYDVIDSISYFDSYLISKDDKGEQRWYPRHHFTEVGSPISKSVILRLPSKFLTVGKAYEVIATLRKKYLVINNMGWVEWYPSRHFDDLPELPEEDEKEVVLRPVSEVFRERITEVLDAINKQHKAGKLIPNHWLTELDMFNKMLRQRVSHEDLMKEVR